ncbi:conjugal transfer ATP-binding protein TraC [Alphaproteobacteria bacterium]
MLFDNNSTTEAEQITKSLYKSKGWELARDRFIVISSLLSMLPMTWGSGLYSDMTYLKKVKTTLSYEPVNLLPIQGEFKGTITPGVLLTGRLGQLFYWYPFDEGMGNTNYNVSVVGRSGSGKSVFMQELVTSVLTQNGRVYVLDVGRSFEKQVKLFEGEFLEFSVKSNLCLNPFSSIDDSDSERIQDSLSVLKPIIAMMAAPKAGTTDYEDSLISKCLNEVWAKYGKDAGVSNISEWFLEQKQDQKACAKLGTMLFPYTTKGPYGRFFSGKSNIDFSSNFFVTELEELKTRPELQSVVVQILMLLITNNVILGGRKCHSGLIFDEAWDLLKGNQGGEFIERLARTLRKYRGALVVGTQNLDDFYSSPGAEAAFMNSDWLCMLSQKKESITRLLKSDKFRIDSHTQKILESVKSKPGEYAEIMIMGGLKVVVSQDFCSIRSQECFIQQKLKNIQGLKNWKHKV